MKDYFRRETIDSHNKKKKELMKGPDCKQVKK
jgi:hypothetical protein